MALADTSANLQETHEAIRTRLEAVLAAGHEILDNLVPRQGSLLGDVAAVASIADDPAMQMMERALPVVPRAILDGIVTMLEAVIAQHAQAQPEQAPEPQPDQQAA